MDGFPEFSGSKGTSSSNADQWKHYVAAIQKYQHGFIADKYGTPQKCFQEGTRTQPSLDCNSMNAMEGSTVPRSNSSTGFTNGSAALTAPAERGATCLDGADPANGRSETTDKQYTQSIELTLGKRMQVGAGHEGLESEMLSKMFFSD